MGDPIRVLHVDDDANFVTVAASLLERERDELTVTTATSADEALERLSGVDCVVSDYDMPGGNGIEFLDAVREEHGDLPFILYTGKGSEEIASEAISAGVTDYLQKGGGTDQYTVLANRIENAVSQYRAERRVERMERRFRTLVEEASDAIFVVDAEGTITYATPASESVLGWPSDGLVGSDAFDRIHPEDTDRATATFEALVEHPGGSRAVEFRYEQPDGSYVWTEARGRNLLEDPVVEGVVVYAHDVSDRKAREGRLEQLTTEYEAIFTNAEDSLFLVDVVGPEDDPEFRVARHNPTHEERTGLSTEDVRGRTHREVLGEQQGTEVEANFRRCVEAGETITYEERLEQPAGERVWETKLTPVSVDGEIVRVVGVSRDVTERREHDRAIRRERDRRSTLFENATDPIVEARDDGGEMVVEAVNPAFEETFGTAAGEVTGTTVIEAMVPDGDEDEHRHLARRARRGEASTTRVRRQTSQGDRKFALHVVPLDATEETAVYAWLVDPGELQGE